MAFEGHLQAEQPDQGPNVRDYEAETDQVTGAGNDSSQWQLPKQSTL